MLPVKTYMVSNAFIPVDDALALMPSLAARIASGERPTAAVFQIHYAGKKLIASLVGGELDPDGPTGLAFTPLGSLTLEAMLPFGNGKQVIFRFLTCTCSDAQMERKLKEVLDFMGDGDAVAFIGDMAGTCDGKILKHLHLRGQVELPRLLDPL